MHNLQTAFHTHALALGRGLVLAGMAAGLLCLGCPDPWATNPDDDDTTADDDSAGDDDTVDLCGDPADAEEGPLDDTCTSTYPYVEFDPQMEVMWQWANPADEPDHFQVLSTPVVINLTDDNNDGAIDDDDIPDVVFLGMANEQWSSDGLLRVVSGEDGSELWYDTSGYELPSGLCPAAGEIDPGSPGPEIVAKTVDDEIICYSAAGDVLWVTPTTETQSSGALSIHDMDHDGEPEIIYGRLILGWDGTIHGIGEYGWGRIHSAYPLSYAVDLDGDGELEVVVGNAAYRKDGSALFYNGLDDGTTAVGDFDLDGDPEVVVSGGGEIRLQDHQGNVVWGPVTTMGGASNGAPPTVADFDGDGFPEIGIADQYYYQLYDTDGSLLWYHETVETSSGFTGSSVFDFNGDGTAEVVYADESYLYIFEGPTGTTLFEEEQHSSRTNIEYPVIVDVDNDGNADIVLGSNVVFEETGWDGVTALTGINETGWWPTRPVWNQHAYFGTNVEDDGTIPQIQLDPWEVHNSFRQAKPATGWDGYPVADLIPVEAALCDTDCPDELSVRLRVHNAGAEAVNAGTAVSIWNAPETQMLAIDWLPEGVEAGWTSATLEIPLDPVVGSVGDMVVHVDWSSTAEGAHTECDEDNNSVVVQPADCD